MVKLNLGQEETAAPKPSANGFKAGLSDYRRAYGRFMREFAGVAQTVAQGFGTVVTAVDLVHRKGHAILLVQVRNPSAIQASKVNTRYLSSLGLQWMPRSMGSKPEHDFRIVVRSKRGFSDGAQR